MKSKLFKTISGIKEVNTKKQNNHALANQVYDKNERLHNEPLMAKYDLFVDLIALKEELYSTKLTIIRWIIGSAIMSILTVILALELVR